MVVWDIRSRPAFDAAVQNLGLIGRANTKVERSWDPRDPDDALSTARLKSMVGEPWYQVASGDTIEMHPTWKATYLPPGRVLLSSAIPVRARCHNAASAAITPKTSAEGRPTMRNEMPTSAPWISAVRPVP